MSEYFVNIDSFVFVNFFVFCLFLSVFLKIFSVLKVFSYISFFCSNSRNFFKCIYDEAKVRNWDTHAWFRVLWDFCSQTRHWSYCLMLMALQSETRFRTQLKNCFRSWRSVEFCRAALESQEPTMERSENQKTKQKKHLCGFVTIT